MESVRKTMKQKLGFTLTEVMFATSILSIASLGLANFTLDSLYGIFWATNKSKISADVRLFTMRITKETLGANTGIVYKSFSFQDRDEYGDRRQSGQSGDCLVLISYDPYPNIDDPKHYTKLTFFFRRPDENGESPVYRAEKVFSTPQPIQTDKGVDHVEAFIAKHFPDNNAEYPVVLELSRGLADGNLFRDFGNNTFLVNGEILHGNTVKEVTNTYNLTISPRG